MPHRVTVERNRLRFAAGHFATFADELEPIHGHNYDVIVEVDGALSDESWVVDFSQLKRLTREVCDTLDHKFLLQMQSPVLTIDDLDSHFEIQYKDGPTYRLPKSDVAALPIDNTTAERLAEYIAGHLVAGFDPADRARLTALRVGVEEMPGQTGWFDADLTADHA
jgi:6-pyruvoyltetrahydropterin/6-carboxytetrahydropterin synthase